MIVDQSRTWRLPLHLPPPFLLRVLGCVTIGMACALAGVLWNRIVDSPHVWLSGPICRSGYGSPRGFWAGLGMGFAMMLLSLAPRRWRSVLSVEGAAIVILWALGAGLLQALILAADRITPTIRSAVPSAIPHLSILWVSVAGALSASSGAVQPSPARDGLRCFLRCGPMMTAMLLTGAMSMPWMIAGGLMTQIDDMIGDRRLSRGVAIGLGLAVAWFITHSR